MRGLPLLTTACGLALLLSSGSAAAQEQIPGWHTSLPSAQAAARESGRPIFLVFRCVR